MDEFEKMLRDVSSGVERFVRYRLPSQSDADDVLQEVYLSAYRNFSGLKNKDAFKSWIISIARNKCNDYFVPRLHRWKYPSKNCHSRNYPLDGLVFLWCIPCGKLWIGLAIKISRYSTCISGKNCPKTRSQSCWRFLSER